MLREYLQKLSEELSAETPRLNEEKVYPFRIGKELVAMQDLDPGLGLHARICACPERRREDLFIFLMHANLLGQGTGGARIGLQEGENFLTLSLGLPYELNYQVFRDAVEDFVNYLIYWRAEVAKFISERQGVL